MLSFSGYVRYRLDSPRLGQERTRNQPFCHGCVRWRLSEGWDHPVSLKTRWCAQGDFGIRFANSAEGSRRFPMFLTYS
jgi:hypothetical protein